MKKYIFDPAIINNETEYLFYAFEMELINGLSMENLVCSMFNHNNSCRRLGLRNPSNVFMKQFVELPQVALENS